MVVKILGSSATFAGVKYNTDKIESGSGDLVAASNFGPLQAMSELRPTDYINYLKMISALNKRVSKPQFHAVISVKGKSESKAYLTGLAVEWLSKMGYSKNPFLIVFHNDTQNNHVHIVSTRIDKTGKKISSAFEKIRAVKFINELTNKDLRQELSSDIRTAMAYRFSTLSQFILLLEVRGYKVLRQGTLLKIVKFGTVQGELSSLEVEKNMQNKPIDSPRIKQLEAIFIKYKTVNSSSLKADKTVSGGHVSELTMTFKSKFGIEIVFHSSESKPPYGYTIIDNSTRQVIKGSQVMRLSQLLCQVTGEGLVTISSDAIKVHHELMPYIINVDLHYEAGQPIQDSVQDNSVQTLSITIADDVDDEATLGRNRRKKGMPKSNSR